MQARELGDVRQERLIGTTVFESDENFSIHYFRMRVRSTR
jgi:hypothetical protein